VAAGLATPMGLALEPSGAALVLEFDSHSLSRIGTNGTSTTVVSGLSSPYALARAQDGVVYVIETGSVSRPTGTLDRVDPDGSRHRIRLLPQRSSTAADGPEDDRRLPRRLQRTSAPRR
jgi:hypothetical protein